MDQPFFCRPMTLPLSPLSLALVLSTALLAGCATPKAPPVSRYENFDSSSTHARPYDATEAQACEAARRALLSQGYMVGTAKNDFVSGRKSFQPEREMHVEIDLRIVCAREGDEGKTAIVFVSAVEDRYALKKNSTSASLGVGVLGSVSVPFSSSDDSLVKVASETIAQQAFYERFFTLIDRYLEKAVP
jgi:hypothetical protein